MGARVCHCLVCTRRRVCAVWNCGCCDTVVRAAPRGGPKYLSAMQRGPDIYSVVTPLGLSRLRLDLVAISRGGLR